MLISCAENTPERRWRLPLGCFQADGHPVQFTLKRPTWYPTVYFGALAGLARTAINLHGPMSIASTIGIYLSCMILAKIIGQVIQKAKGERVSRICSSTLGLTVLAVTIIGHGANTRPEAANVWTQLVIPLGAVTIMVLLNLLGEAMITWFPVRDTSDDPTPPNRRLRYRPRWRKYAS